MPGNYAAAPLLAANSTPPDWCGNRLHLSIAGHDFDLRRDQDMDALWESLGQDGFGADERMPYWAEIWPASLLLTAWLAVRQGDVAGRRCLDLGCGMGLSALAGAAVGGHVVAVDYEEAAVAHAARNAGQNGLRLDLAVMDWRRPCFAAGRFERIWGSDILYEARFYAPLVTLFREMLAPGGRIWLSQPWRQVSEPVWERLSADGFTVVKAHEESVSFSTYRSTVSLYEISL
ncbi:Methyltransferase type 11 [Solidesulfovibrio fructosivorans JJ]]|uniref:Methyltransferase type 11 n=1 Tax=Solidesulfovibrio fructosivorans JJ] TaxID=596151 RepID=E1JZF0_SOLFR|nr:methyltransferase domain-containing protein [Solidesulfovibrio fructosivorans]EFL50310.1 Methyltransferase type 11 [Solidesulfovibrio fructosivorans JJ]]